MPDRDALTLVAARTIIARAFETAAELSLKPLTVAVLDAGGHVVALERQDGSSLIRPKMAHAKAYGALALGIGPRAIHHRAEQQPYFVQAMNALCDGAMLPVPGGALIRAADGSIIGAVGATGDTSDNDETCVVAGIEAAGFTADTGG